MSSIYESEQYLFEIAQSFIRSRVVFSSIELQIFDLLLFHSDGLTCADIARHLNLHFIDKQSRCLQDCLDCLASMHFLELNRETHLYRLTKLTRNYLLPNRVLLSNLEKDFYSSMAQCYQIHDLSPVSLQQVMVLRVQELVNLSAYSKIDIDTFDETSEVIIFWQEANFCQDTLQQAFDSLPRNPKGLLILVLPSEQADEVSLAMRVCLQMSSDGQQAKENVKALCSKKFLQQIGFRAVEKVQTGEDLQLLLAFK